MDFSGAVTRWPLCPCCGVEMVDDKPVELSLISPVYGCAACLDALCERMIESVRPLGISFEIILVDDRGPDNSWNEIVRLARKYPGHLRALRLSRNFGQQVAITAGLAECRGNVAVVLDCDLQDPPEEIPRLYAKYLEGYQIVLTRRIAKKHSFFKRSTSIFYTKFIKLFTGTRIEPEVGGFSLISRPVIHAFLQFRDINRHYLSIIHWVGFEKAYVDYEHQARAAGESGYTFRKLVKLALQGLLFQNTRLMKAILVAGLVLIALGGCIALWAFACLWSGQPAPGWAAMSICICLIGGFIVFIQGLVGIYVEQVFEHVKQRPLYIISDRIQEDNDTRNFAK